MNRDRDAHSKLLLFVSVFLLALGSSANTAHTQGQSGKIPGGTRDDGDVITPEIWQRLRLEHPKVFKSFVLTAQMTLGRLGYGTGPFDGILDEKTKKALKEYQANAEFPPTGELDRRTFDKLETDRKVLDPDVLNLPSFHFIPLSWENYISLGGTWVIEGEKQGIPLQTSEIACHREWMACIQATAAVNPLGLRTLTIDTELYEIERWDEHEIVTKPVDKACVRYTMRISRSLKAANALRSTLNTKGLCDGIEKRDLRLRLEDGFKTYWALEQEKGRKIRDLIRANWKALEEGAALADAAERALGID